jgi:23S rRNA pseudouridine2457 synthase
MTRYFLVYKPYRVLSQFTSTDGKECLKDYFKLPKSVYSVGRLDYDSEGLLILTNDKALNTKLLHPAYKHSRSYLVQVDGSITHEAVHQLEKGVTINIDGKLYHTLPAKARIVEEPGWLPERNPPIRTRKSVPTSWIELTLTEGKNRQVRKMTAAVGFPTLRLIRIAIEGIELGNLKPGDIKEISRNTIYSRLFNERL